MATYPARRAARHVGEQVARPRRRRLCHGLTRRLDAPARHPSMPAKPAAGPPAPARETAAGGRCLVAPPASNARRTGTHPAEVAGRTRGAGARRTRGRLEAGKCWAGALRSRKARRQPKPSLLFPSTARAFTRRGSPWSHGLRLPGVRAGGPVGLRSRAGARNPRTLGRLSTIQEKRPGWGIGDSRRRRALAKAKFCFSAKPWPRPARELGAEIGRGLGPRLVIRACCATTGTAAGLLAKKGAPSRSRMQGGGGRGAGGRGGGPPPHQRSGIRLNAAAQARAWYSARGRTGRPRAWVNGPNPVLILGSLTGPEPLPKRGRSSGRQRPFLPGAIPCRHSTKFQDLISGLAQAR